MTNELKENYSKLALANGATDWRWQVAHANADKPSVSILWRGANRKTIVTISANETPDLYPHWQPVIDEWRKRKQTSKRTRHDGYDNRGNLQLGV